MAVVLLFFFLIIGLSIAALVFWIVSLVEVIRLEDWRFRAAGTDKVLWVVLVALLHWVGALVWRFTYRDRVLYAQPSAGSGAPVPPSWQPDPQGSGLRWWDGAAWTDHTDGK